MPIIMENIIKTIKSTSGMSDSSINELTLYFEKIHLPQKHILIREGVIDRNFILLNKG